MNAEQFAMWLHGYLEISDPKEIGEKETQIIKDHLNLLFKKETPDRTVDFKKIYEEQVKVSPGQGTKLLKDLTAEEILGTFKRSPLPGSPVTLPQCKCAPGTFCSCYLAVTC